MENSIENFSHRARSQGRAVGNETPPIGNLVDRLNRGTITGLPVYKTQDRFRNRHQTFTPNQIQKIISDA